MITLQRSRLIAVTKIIDRRAERLSLTSLKMCSPRISWPRAKLTSHKSATKVEPFRIESRGAIQ